jgi:hypothetical protein
MGYEEYSSMDLLYGLWFSRYQQKEAYSGVTTFKNMHPIISVEILMNV